MDTYNLKPEHMRAPDHLSKEEIKKSLHELDTKIKTLEGRINATTADSRHTYHEHVAALEAKRALLASKLSQTQEHDTKSWSNFRNDLSNLHNDVDRFMKE